MSTVSLTIDYSNGAQTHFSSIPWKKGLTILDAIEACAKIPPGVAVSFGSDRSGHTLGLVVGEVAGDEALKWLVWVNAKPFPGGDRLGTETSFNFHPDEREVNLLKPGDHVLFKLTSVAADR